MAERADPQDATIVHDHHDHHDHATVGVGVAAQSSPSPSSDAVEIVVDADTDGDLPSTDAPTVHAVHAVSLAHDHERIESTGDEGSVADVRATPSRVVRGRYAKFTANMDVVMLEAMRTHNPFTAKHGTRLQMWQLVAEAVGEETLQNPDAYSWHTCRDRVTTLMKLFAEGKHDKLFKHGTIEENARKEAILRELHLLLHHKGAKPGSVVRAPTQLEASLANPLLLHGAAAVVGGAVDGVVFGAVGDSAASASAGRGGRPANGTLGRSGSQAPQKRRRVDGTAHSASRTGDGASLDTETFRARVLELMEAKIHFDMEQRAKENELREHEFELQKRFLEYLQSK